MAGGSTGGVIVSGGVNADGFANGVITGGPAAGVVVDGAAGVSISGGAGGAGITGVPIGVGGGIPVPMDGIFDGGVSVVVNNVAGPVTGGGVVIDSGILETGGIGDINTNNDIGGIGDINSNNFDRITELNNIVDSLNIGNTINH